MLDTYAKLCMLNVSCYTCDMFDKRGERVGLIADRAFKTLSFNLFVSDSY